MKKQKKLLSFFIFLIILINILPIFTFAHSGRTDSQGGHYDRSTGEYHFHHGRPAHYHINGICPYSTTTNTKKNNTSNTYNNYNTNKNINNSSYENNYSNYNNTNNYTKEEKEYKYEKYKPVINEIEKEKYISRNLKLIIFVLLLLIIIIFIF